MPSVKTHQTCHCVILEEGEFNRDIIYIKLVKMKYAAFHLILKGMLNSLLRSRLGDMT